MLFLVCKGVVAMALRVDQVEWSYNLLERSLMTYIIGSLDGRRSGVDDRGVDAYDDSDRQESEEFHFDLII